MEPLSAMTTSPQMPIAAKLAWALVMQSARVRSSLRQGITALTSGGSAVVCLCDTSVLRALQFMRVQSSTG